MKNRAYEKWKETLILSAKQRKTPIAGQYELTACCNLDCKMCYIHNADSNALRAKELSTDTWKRIFDEAYEMGLMFATLSGGECFLRPDFKELYLHLWNKRVRISIFTNGTLIDDEYVAFFKKYPPEFIRVSLYGSCEEGYLRVTGHKGFDKAVTAIRKLMAENIPVGVSVTPSVYMKDDFTNTRRFCLENGFDCQPSNYFLASKRDDNEDESANLTIDEIVELAKQEALIKRKITPAYDTPKPCGVCKEAPKGLACGAGSSSALVNPEGKMFPCAMLPHGDNSLLVMSYAEAWEKTKKATSEMLLGMECVGCAYDQLCPKCPAMRLTGLYTGHCNPDVCEITRKLVEAGVHKIPEKS